jgi:hypothetical protein
MQKINELLTSGQINGIEYYNYFKNRNDFTKNNQEDSYYNKLNRITNNRNVNTTNSLAITSSLFNGSNISLNRYTGKQQPPPIVKSNKQKFNAYLMNNNTNNNNNDTTSQRSISPPQQQKSPILSASQSFTNLKQSSSNFDKKKEDAINRIIRNERIKEIRTKIYEYELLKEYQKYNDNNNKTFELYNSTITSNDDDSASVDSYCTDYGFESIENDDDFYENQVIPLGVINNRKSLSPNNLTTNQSFSYSDLTDNNDSTTTTHTKTNDEEDSSINDNKQQKRRTKNIKPGHELYQIGNLNTPQSAFQLKCSIISVELKNIINVLKQVRLNIPSTFKLKKKSSQILLSHS